jgi:hypothetical protein
VCVLGFDSSKNTEEQNPVTCFLLRNVAEHQEHDTSTGSMRTRYTIVERGKINIGVPWASVYVPRDGSTHIYFGHDAGRG